MGLGKKKTLLDQAGEYVDAARPHVEQAIENAKDFVQETAIPALSDAKEKAGPVIADARAKAGPALAEAKEKAAPLIASGAALAAEKATAAKEAADAKVNAMKPEPKKKKKSKLKRFLLFGAIAGGVAAIAKKIQAGASSDNWQSSYTPSPPPSDAPTPPTPAAPQSGGDPLTDPLPEDPGGASPDEALADSAEAPHPATTPDDPAEVVDLEEGKKN
jgi:hypothetical protein